MCVWFESTLLQKRIADFFEPPTTSTDGFDVHTSKVIRQGSQFVCSGLPGKQSHFCTHIHSQLFLLLLFWTAGYKDLVWNFSRFSTTAYQLNFPHALCVRLKIHSFIGFGLTPHTLSHYVTHGQSRDFHGFPPAAAVGKTLPPQTHTHSLTVSPIASLLWFFFCFFFLFFCAQNFATTLTTRVLLSVSSLFSFGIFPAHCDEGEIFFNFPPFLSLRLYASHSKQAKTVCWFIWLTLSVRFSSVSSSPSSFATLTCPHTSQRDYF